MLQPKITYISPEEYLAMEESAEYRSEYYHGEIFAMSGGTFHHNLAVSNIITALNNALHDRNCFVFPPDIKIAVDPDRHYAYPDVSVVCGDIRFFKDRTDIFSNPLVIFEVLSESTQDYDRGSKFKAYRKLASLREYILVDQYSYAVEDFYKTDTGIWNFREFNNVEDTVSIESLNVELPLKTIYHRIQIAQEESPLENKSD